MLKYQVRRYFYISELFVCILCCVCVLFFSRDHAEKAIEILGNILQPDHLLLSSSKRVKGEWFTLMNVCKGNKYTSRDGNYVEYFAFFVSSGQLQNKKKHAPSGANSLL